MSQSEGNSDSRVFNEHSYEVPCETGAWTLHICLKGKEEGEMQGEAEPPTSKSYSMKSLC